MLIRQSLAWMVTIQPFTFKTSSLTISIVQSKVEGNGNCIFSTMKKSLQVRHSGSGGSRDKGRELPYYPNRYFQRQLVHWMAVNCQGVMHYMGPAIRATYGVAHPMASHGGPFSYATYLRKLLKKQFWGDEIVLWSISMMWGLKISVLNSKTLQEHRIRHDCAFRHVNVGLVYNSHTHYSAAG